jgi:hypothetical protein
MPSSRKSHGASGLLRGPIVLAAPPTSGLPPGSPVPGVRLGCANLAPSQVDAAAGEGPTGQTPTGG